MNGPKVRHSGSSLFLIEIIIAIGFFSLACAVCVQLFVKAHLMNTQSCELSRSVICAQNAAEAFKAADGDIERTAELLGAAAAENIIMICYDENWQVTDMRKSAPPAYRMIITRYESNGLVLADIMVSRASFSEHKSAPPTPIYCLQIQTLGSTF